MAGQQAHSIAHDPGQLADAAPEAECRLCLGAHDPAVHQAAARVREALKEQMRLVTGFRYTPGKKNPKARSAMV
jgi:hypothetical protein